jgi:uncharacterized membrane protein
MLSKNKFIIYTLFVAFLGFLDATYLTLSHYQNSIPPCTVAGCEVVLTSRYAIVLGIPLALLGSLFYLSVMSVSLLILTNYKEMFLKIFYFLAVTGFIVSLILSGIQAFDLKAFCQYCLASAATSTGIAILAFLEYRRRGNTSS